MTYTDTLKMIKRATPFGLSLAGPSVMGQLPQAYNDIQTGYGMSQNPLTQNMQQQAGVNWGGALGGILPLLTLGGAAFFGAGNNGAKQNTTNTSNQVTPVNKPNYNAADQQARDQGFLNAQYRQQFYNKLEPFKDPIKRTETPKTGLKGADRWPELKKKMQQAKAKGKEISFWDF